MLHQPGGTAVITAIGGTAGVGKTALAVQWAHQVAEEFPDGQLFVNLRGFDPSAAPVAPGDAVRVLLDALDIPAERLPQTFEAQLGLYRSLLSGKRILVVLDNARDAAQVRPLLPGCPTCRVVVTSRNQLTGLAVIEAAHPLTLDVLTGAEARQLLRQRLGAGRLADDPAAVAQIIASCAHLPLALSIIAARAAMRPDLSLGQIAADLTAHPNLDAFTGGGDPAADIRAAFSWSYLQLDSGAARVFRLTGLHPGPAFDRYAVAALTATTAAQADHMLDTLALACMIQPAGPVRYGMHDLLRGYAHELADAEDSEDRRAALTRLFGYYLHTAAAATDTLYPAESNARPGIPRPATPVPPITNAAAARAWLDAERASLIATAVYAAEHGWPGYAASLSTTMFRYLDIGGHYLEAIIIHDTARRLARRTGDRAAEANALKNLGSVGMRQRRYQQAADYYQQSLAVSLELGDVTVQAQTLGNLGFVEFLQGRCDQATGHMERALALHKESGDRSGQAHALANLGFFDLRQGRYQQAAEHLRQSLAIFRDTRDRGGEAHALGNLGEVTARQGDYQQAAEHIRQALAVCREIGDRSNAADMLASLGLTDLRQGDYPQAASHLQEALALCRETGDLSTQATALNGLGEVLLASGRPAEARTRHASALDLAAQAGEKYEQARAHDGLAHVYQAGGDQRKARSHWHEAVALYAALGAPEADRIRVHMQQTFTATASRAGSR